MGKKKTVAQPVIEQAQERYKTTTEPSALENEFQGFRQGMQNQYGPAAERQTQDYGNIMSAYQQFREGLTGPTQFSFKNVSAPRPKELGEGYGYLREAMPGYREFSKTGGYSPTDIQELRARGISPIRAAYGNTMMELDRARSLGGASGTPNYIAALSRAQRELPEQLASATTDVNARLADSIRQGRMFGLQGISGTGRDMGGLASAEAGRQLQASLANQDADLRAQGLTEQSLQNMRQSQLASLGGQASLYGTTPAMASMFGNQALSGFDQQRAMEQMRNQFGLGLMSAQMQGYGMPQDKPWWQTGLEWAGKLAPYAAAPFTGGASLLAAPMTSQIGSGPFTGSTAYSW